MEGNVERSQSNAYMVSGVVAGTVVTPSVPSQGAYFSLYWGTRELPSSFERQQRVAERVM